MRYPGIILFRHEKYANVIDEYISNNRNKFKFEVLLTTSNTAHLTKLWDPTYTLLITYGETHTEYNISLPTRLRERWIHYDHFDDSNIEQINTSLTYCFLNNVVAKSRQDTRPVFSIFTTCYNSFDKIIRAYNSIRNQTFQDWEWVIIDDSPKYVDNKHKPDHFTYLCGKFKDDSRVRVYNRSNNSGSIGNVKNEAIALCRGKYILEMDHDDEIVPNLLDETTSVFESNPEIGFVYTNCANINEDGSNFKYGDFYGMGYCGYYCQKWFNPSMNRLQWINVSASAQINNVTLMHLISLPNHPRMWRATTLRDMGSYSEFLPVCDDQEILMRTAMNTKMAKLNIFGYMQYMNSGGNNFSLIRNSEISRIGPKLCKQFYDNHNVVQKFKDIDKLEDESYRTKRSPLWTRDPNTYHPKYVNKLISSKSVKKEVAFIGKNAFLTNLDKIKELLSTTGNDIWILDGTMSSADMCELVDANLGALTRDQQSFVKCYAMPDTPEDQMVKYFLWVCQSCDNYELITDIPVCIHRIIDDNTKNNGRQIFGVASRAEAINRFVKPEHSYVEIGVEYGLTFNNVCSLDKTAVDPDPKFVITDNEQHKKVRMCKVTSDEFFNHACCHKQKYDAIFIDGMHQSEYVIRDVENAITCVCGGFTNDTEMPTSASPKFVFLDDVWPNNEREQHKMPQTHVYEHGVLKTREPWTGDVWKVLYHMLKAQSVATVPFFTYQVFTHPSYRGVVALTIIRPFYFEDGAIDIINSYTYKDDFTNYIQMLTA